MIEKGDVEKAFEHTINSLEKVESPSEILTSIDELQSLTIIIGYIKKESTFFIIGDALSTLSYHLKDVYSKYIPGMVPPEIQTAATTKIKETLNRVTGCLKILRKELFKKEDPDYKILVDSLGKIYIAAYDLYKFETSHIIPSVSSGE